MLRSVRILAASVSFAATVLVLPAFKPGGSDAEAHEPVAEPLPLGKVRLIGENRLTSNRDLDIRAILSWDVRKFLYNYLDTYGLDTSGCPLPEGWDSVDTKLKGHGSGHYMSALALAFAGCVLVSGISGEGLTLTGLLLGLGSGIGYGLYSILGTVALRKYSPYTVTTYTFLFAAAGSWMVCRPADMISKISATDNLTGLLLFCVLTGLVTAVIPFLAYTLGLRTVEASRAGILATIEPLVATLVGIVVFSEPLTLLSGLGIVLILTAVVLLNRKQPIENKVYEKEV